MKHIPPLNNFGSRKEWEEALWSEVVKDLSHAGSFNSISKILDLLLPDFEKHRIGRRAAAAYLLNQGKSHREISKELWLSLQTISTIKKSFLKHGKYISYHSGGSRYTKDPSRKSFIKSKYHIPSLYKSSWLLRKPRQNRRKAG
ncbi:MAG: hypothetical protein HYS87_00310 [Candidatus Colwellbacteria bacterium]|nr:hypothetical protein [Candidatus Colwellbacteria bacterium]